MPRRFAAGVLREAPARPMEDPSKTLMDELARTSGVVGVDRLAALFVKRFPDAARIMSKTEVRKMANEVLRVKPDKQVLAYPAERSGGAVHASRPNAVWQIDLADMRTFNEKKTGDVHTHMLVCVDVFSRFTRTAIRSTTSCSFRPYPELASPPSTALYSRRPGAPSFFAQSP